MLTLNEMASGSYDPNTLQEIPKEVPVYRAYYFEPERKAIELLKRIFGIKGVEKKFSVGDVNSQRKESKIEKDGIKALLNHVKVSFDKFTYRNILIPDDLLLWILPAALLGRRICQKHQVNLILTTAPPFSDLLVGRLLKTMTSLPWVADYRDLWSGDVLRDWVPGWRRKIEVSLERWALARADGVTAVSEPKVSFLKKRLSGLPIKNIFCVTNGYDPDEYEGIEKLEPNNGRVRFVYTGRLFKNRRGYEIVEAAGLLFRQKPHLRNRFLLEYYGGVTDEIKTKMEQLINEYQLNEEIRFLRDVPYTESKEIQVSADVLLLIVDTGETTSGVIPGKLFEYIAARRPILCIAVPGATSEIIEKGRLGWVIPPGDVNALKKTLEKILSEAPLTFFKPDINYLAQFERKRLVGELAQIFDRISISRCK